MDFSEKDAARSKWKLTQRHRRGRGRGPASGAVGAAGRGGRGGRGGAATAARDLGTNEDRYYDAEAEAAAAAAALGPVQQSQGADLADLLARAEPFDRGFYFQTRAHLSKDVGLPPQLDAGSYQGLSLDLRGLATCLELLPTNLVLETDAFSEDGQAEGGGSGGEDGGSDGEEFMTDLEDGEEEEGWNREPGQQQAVAAGQQQGQQQGDWRPAAAAAAAAAPGAALPATAPGITRQQRQPQVVAAAPAAPASPAAAPPVAAAAAALGDSEVDDLLSELLGEKASIAASSSDALRTASAPSLGVAGLTQSRPMAPAAAAVGAQQQPQAPAVDPAAARQGPPPQRPEAGRLGAAADDHDDELDLLLGLGASKAPAAAAAGAAPAAVPAGPPASGGHAPRLPAAAARSQAPEEQSLEDWLDAL